MFFYPGRPRTAEKCRALRSNADDSFRLRPRGASPPIRVAAVP